MRVVEHPVIEALGRLRAAVDALAGAPLWSMTEPDVLDALDEAETLTAKFDHARLRLVREADSRGAATSAGAVSTAAWLRSRLRRHPAAAHRDVVLARALTEEHTATGSALAAGEISRAHAEVVVRTLGALPAGVPAETRGSAEVFLLEQAAEHDPQVLARLGRHLRHAVDPDAGDTLARDEQAAVAGRELFVSPDLSGQFVLRGRLDPVAAAALLGALSPLAAPRAAAGDAERDLRSPARRRADALVELVELALHSPAMPTEGGRQPQVQLTVDLQTLETRLGAVGGVLDWAGPVSAETARLLACDARVIPVVLGTRGEPLDVGRGAYTAPAGLRRAVLVRDGGCAFPGCDRPPPWCDVHHCTHWADGGATALANLVALCGRHHATVHHGGWRACVGADGRPMFIPPPWVDPAQVPRSHGWRERLHDLAHALAPPPLTRPPASAGCPLLDSGDPYAGSGSPVHAEKAGRSVGDCDDEPCPRHRDTR